MRPIAAGREPSLIQLDADARPGPPTDFIYNDWYPALRTDTLREPVTTTLLNIPLLLGRKRDNSLFALRDLCPHRGIPLSAGWFDGETVQCKYHGWRFEPCSGRCEEIPSLTSHDNLEPTKIFANAFPVAERDGYAWVYIPAPGAGRIIPTADRTTSDSRHPEAKPKDLCISDSHAANNSHPSPPSPSSQNASAPRTSPPISPATSTTASSASWTPRTAPSCTRPGGGARREHPRKNETLRTHQLT